MKSLDQTDILRRRWHSTSSIAALVLMGLSLGTGAGMAAVEPTGTASATSRPEIAKLLSQAAAAMKDRHPEVAAIYLKNAETMAPNDATINFSLGQALLATGNAAQAEREYRSAIQHGMASNKVLPQIYDSMLVEQQPQKLLDEFPDPQPADRSSLAADTLRARALAQVQLNQKDMAAASMDRALAITRTLINLTMRAQLAHDAGDDALATKLVGEALGKDPSNANALTIKISMLQAANQPDQALVIANSLVKATNNSPFALVTLPAYTCSLNRTTRLSPMSMQLFMSCQRCRKAFFTRRKCWRARRTPKEPGLWRKRYRPISCGRGTISPSRSARWPSMPDTGKSQPISCRAAVQAFPNSVNARVNLAIDYLALNEAPHALETLRPLADGTDPRAMVLLGQIYQKQNNSSEALKYYEKASAAGFGGDILKEQIATTNFREGSLDDAVKEFSELYAKQPDNPAVAGPLIASLARQGNRDAASKIADRLVSIAPKSPYGPLYQGQLFAAKGI